jgi:hypothetical protein
VPSILAVLSGDITEAGPPNQTDVRERGMALFEIVLSGIGAAEIDDAAKKAGYSLKRLAATGSSGVRFCLEDNSSRFERGREMADAILAYGHADAFVVSVNMAIATAELSDADLEAILSARYGEYSDQKYSADR